MQRTDAQQVFSCDAGVQREQPVVAVCTALFTRQTACIARRARIPVRIVFKYGTGMHGGR